MSEIRLVVKRNFTERPDDVNEQQRLHRERAKLLHNFVDTLDLTVKDWENTDSAKAHEVVTIIIALGSAGVFNAIVAISKAWMERDTFAEVTLIGPGGSFTLKNGTAADVVTIAPQIGFKSTS